MGKCLSKSPKVQSQTPGQHPGQGAGSNNNAVEGAATANAAQNQGTNPMLPDVCAQRGADPALELYVLSVLQLCACNIKFYAFHASDRILSCPSTVLWAT